MSPELKERFEFRCQRLGENQKAIAGLLARKASAASPDPLDLPSFAWLLEASYSDMEEVLKGIARHFDDPLPSSPSSHRDLLDSMTLATSKREAVLTETLRLDLDPYRTFRHFSRYATFVVLNWEELSVLVAGLDDVVARFIGELSGFLDRASRPD